MNQDEKVQQQHYNETYEDYVNHYDSPLNLIYDELFIYSRLFENKDFFGKKVLDVGCGSGQTTKYLRQKGAFVTGLDLSQGMAKAFKKVNPENEIIVGSARTAKLNNNYYDFIIVHTALHHMHPDVHETVHNLTSALKKGGYFLWVEPHTDGFLDKIRNLWYKIDNRFEPNEKGINSLEMESYWEKKYLFLKKYYVGNINYFFVFQSYILRTPLLLRYILFFGFLPIEGIIHWLNMKHLSFLVVHQWKKQ